MTGPTGGAPAAGSPAALLGLSAEEVLTTTRAVRRRLDLTRPVARELVLDCVRVATQAPSGRNRQQYDFVVVDDPARRAALAHLWRAGLAAPDGPGGVGVPVVRCHIERILSLHVDGTGFSVLGKQDGIVRRLQVRYPVLRPVQSHTPYEAAA